MNRMEELRIEQMLRLGCCACAHLQLFSVGEVHHLLEGGQRMGDWFTICLCPGHHRSAWSDEHRAILHPHQLVSIADGRKAFSKIYPTEREFWDRTQQQLGLTWPYPKLVPRRVA